MGRKKRERLGRSGEATKLYRMFVWSHGENSEKFDALKSSEMQLFPFCTLAMVVTICTGRESYF